MTPVEHEAIERAIESHCREGDYAQAVERAISGYGREMRSWLGGILRNQDDAAEVYAILCEHIWKGIHTFRWQSTFRTWAYALARNAALRFVRSIDHTVTGDDEHDVVVVQPRSETHPWFRTEIKDMFARLRERLDVEDRMLLVLRVDRQLSWEDIVSVVAQDETDDPALRRKKAAALRQQFQRLKDRLRGWARAEGLIDERA